MERLRSLLVKAAGYASLLDNASEGIQLRRASVAIKAYFVIHPATDHNFTLFDAAPGMSHLMGDLINVLAVTVKEQGKNNGE